MLCFTTRDAVPRSSRDGSGGRAHCQDAQHWRGSLHEPLRFSPPRVAIENSADRQETRRSPRIEMHVAASALSFRDCARRPNTSARERSTRSRSHDAPRRTRDSELSRSSCRFLRRAPRTRRRSPSHFQKRGERLLPCSGLSAGAAPKSADRKRRRTDRPSHRRAADVISRATLPMSVVARMTSHLSARAIFRANLSSPLVRRNRAARFRHFLKEEDERGSHETGEREQPKILHVTEQRRLLLQHAEKNARRLFRRFPLAAVLREPCRDRGQLLLEDRIELRGVR